MILVLVLMLTPAAMLAADAKVLKMSTTTSTQSSGLLDVLLPELEKDTGITVKVIAKGTGAAIRDGIDGNVDIIFVHAKTREEKFVADGYGTQRYAVMHNDFVIVGPPSDPAGIKGIKSGPEALARIAASQAGFVSRGDDSGTHTKEQQLWTASGVTLAQKATQIVKKGKARDLTYTFPEKMGDRYFSIGQGMGKTLLFADQKQVYTLVDRGTYLKYTLGIDNPVESVILCEGDAQLFNPYGIIPINPKKHPHVKFDLADQMAKWLVSQRGQQVIADYRLLNKPLFFPDARDVAAQ